MPFNQTQLEAIERAIASGTQTVEFSGPQGSRRVTYRSLDELLKARDLARRDLGLIAGRTSVRMSADKGTDS